MGVCWSAERASHGIYMCKSGTMTGALRKLVGQHFNIDISSNSDYFFAGAVLLFMVLLR